MNRELRDPAAGPTAKRRWVVVFAMTLAAIAYTDRVCISQAEGSITRELHLSPEQMGWVFGAFFWAYALFEIPGGWLGDRFGARWVLTRVVVWWSFFTAATGWVWSFRSLFATRLLFGAGEAGCFPNIATALKAWLPRDERVRAQGLMWLCARWGGAFTPLLVAFMLDYMSWRTAFGVFGAVGFVWAVFFYGWYRDHPRENKSVNAAERALIGGSDAGVSGHGPVPWKKFFSSRTALLFYAQVMCLNYGWTFYITWLPKYLKEAHGVDLKKGALLAALPLFFGGLGSFFCGYILPPLARGLGSVVKARRVMACIGFGGAAFLLGLSVFLKNPVAAMVAMGLASFCNDLVMPTLWATVMDIGGKHVGTLAGSANMMGNIAAGALPVAIPMLLQATGHNWPFTICVSAAVYFMGLFCWLFMDPVTPLDSPEPAR